MSASCPGCAGEGMHSCAKFSHYTIWKEASAINEKIRAAHEQMVVEAAAKAIKAAKEIKADPSNYVPITVSKAAKPKRGLLVDRLGFERIVDGPLGYTHIVPYRTEDGIGQAVFEEDGETTRDGERLVKYRERIEGPPRLEENADRVHGMVSRQAIASRTAERQRGAKLAD